MGGPSRCPLPFRGGRTGDLPGVASPSVAEGLGICRLPFHGRSGPSLQIPSTALSLSLCVTGAGSSVWLGSHVSTAPRPLPDRSAFEVGGVPSGQPSQRAGLQALGSGRLGSVRWLARRVRPPGSAPNSGSAGKALGSVSPPDAPGDCGVDRRGDIWSGSGSQRPAWPPARGSPPPCPAWGPAAAWAHTALSPRRLEQPYFSANAQFFQALSQCSALQRLCLVSRSGTLQPEAVLAFMARCLHVVVCHMFTGESLATCKSLQQSLLRR